MPYKDPEKQREASRRWRKANSDKQRQQNRRWREANPDKARAASDRWRAENTEKARASANRWKAEHREQNRESMRRWRAANPDYARQWRARKKAAATLAAVTPFKLGEHVVHGVCGVGRVVGVERMEVAGAAFDALVVEFTAPRTTLRVPADRVAQALRPLASRETVQSALRTLSDQPRVSTLNWAKREADLRARLQSGDLIAIAGVARDTRRCRSDGERTLHERAVARIAAEQALVEVMPIESAMAKIAAREGACRRSST